MLPREEIVEPRSLLGAYDAHSWPKESAFRGESSTVDYFHLKGQQVFQFPRQLSLTMSTWPLLRLVTAIGGSSERTYPQTPRQLAS